MHDSGNRKAFDTGAVREAEDGKGRYDLIPFRAIHRLALVLEKGGKKYGDRNWEKGINFSNYVGHAISHISQWALGYKDEDHLGHAFCNIAMLIHTVIEVEEGRLPAYLADMGPDRARPGKTNTPITGNITDTLIGDGNWVQTPIGMQVHLKECTCEYCGGKK